MRKVRVAIAGLFFCVGAFASRPFDRRGLDAEFAVAGPLVAAACLRSLVGGFSDRAARRALASDQTFEVDAARAREEVEMLLVLLELSPSQLNEPKIRDEARRFLEGSQGRYYLVEGNENVGVWIGAITA